ncbi:MAG TPA: acetoin utilization protein AcuC, partial [Dehalococcoidia bacterium]|nr:acetoin utilization protein AcuC [Dehalococcoidia bacterium]
MTRTPESTTGEHASALFIHPLALGYDFGPGHPLRPLRLRALLDLIHALDPGGRWGSMVEPEPAGRAQLLLAHSADYLDAVEHIDATLTAGERVAAAHCAGYGLGPGDTPAFAGMHAASAAVAGATYAAVKAVVERRVRHAFSPSGGLHHAMADHASGFCVYNDVVVGIAGALAGSVSRVLYLDFDAHHGDGV